MRHTTNVWVGSLLAAVLVVACGGVVEGGSRESDKNVATAPAEASPSKQGGSDNPDADTDLGPCTLGVPEARAEYGACAWVAEDCCYESREMACNCACPRSHDSQCLSGFESGPSGHVWVACS